MMVCKRKISASSPTGALVLWVCVLFFLDQLNNWKTLFFVSFWAQMPFRHKEKLLVVFRHRKSPADSLWLKKGVCA